MKAFDWQRRRAALDEFAEIAGPRTLKWGALAIASAIAAFLLDLAFAATLQRFLGSIDLISVGASRSSLLGPLGSAWIEAALFLLAGVLRIGMMWANGYATGVCSVTFESNQRRDIAQWALSYGKASLGEFTTLFNDIVVGAAAVASNTFYMASRFVLIAATLAALVWYSPWVTLCILLLVVLAMPLHRLIDRRLNAVSAVLQRSLAEAVNRLVAGVKNSAFLHVHGLTEQEAGRARAFIGSYERNSRAYYQMASARNAIPQLIGLVVVIGIAIGGSAVFGDDRGSIIAYLYLALRLFQSLSELARVTANIRVNLVRYDVLRNWRRQHWITPQMVPMPVPAVAPSAAPIGGPIGWQLRGATFAHAGATSLFENLSLRIAPGTATVIVGPSGIGKTSLLLLLAGVLKATRGEVLVAFPDGEFSVDSARHRLAPALAFVGPDPFVVPGTLREFLSYGLAAPLGDAELFAALRQAHCEFVFDLGLEHRLSEQGEGLSAGQKQRLAIARALLRRPQALLLDEPTANLDGEAERVLIGMLARIKGDCTIVAVTHSDELKGIADQVVTLGDPAPSASRAAVGG